MKDAVIELSALRDGEELSSLLTYGACWREGDEICVEFEGEAPLGRNSERVQIRILGQDRVRIFAVGEGNPVSFVLERGPKVHYLSDDDNSCVTLTAGWIHSTMNERGGRLSLQYNIAYDRMLSVENEMTLNVCPSAEKGSFSVCS